MIYIFARIYTLVEHAHRQYFPDDIWLVIGTELHLIPRSGDPVEIGKVTSENLRSLEDVIDCTAGTPDKGVLFGFSVIKAATCLDTYEWLMTDIDEYWVQCYNRCDGINRIIRPGEMGLMVDMDPSFINAMATVCGEYGVPLWYKLNSDTCPVEIILSKEV